MARRVPVRTLLLVVLGMWPLLLLGCAEKEAGSAPIEPGGPDGTGGSSLLPGGDGTGGIVFELDAGAPDDAGDCVLADGTRCVYQVVDAGPTTWYTQQIGRAHV